MASELSPDLALREAERRKADSARTKALAAQLRAMLERRFAGVNLAPGQRAFLGGQARVLERALATPRLRDATHGRRAARGRRRAARFGNRDAGLGLEAPGRCRRRSRRGRQQALESERWQAGLTRLNQALDVLGPGAHHLVTLGPLGRDVGSVGEGEIRRITRARRQRQSARHGMQPRVTWPRACAGRVRRSARLAAAGSNRAPVRKAATSPHASDAGQEIRRVGG
ncbi:MAG: hypothetical protein WDO74_31175 [Pseudomonadota bacterium]